MIAVLVFVVCILPISNGPSSQSLLEEPPILSIEPTFLQLSTDQIGQTINVNITVCNVTNLWSWAVTELSFNPAVLKITQVTEGPFLQQTGQTLFLWSSSSSTALQQGWVPVISSTSMEYDGVSGDGVLATLTFQILSSGTSQIAFNQTTLLTPTVLSPGIHEVINGTVTINGDVTVLRK
jgi:hypothetical protein